MVERQSPIGLVGALKTLFHIIYYFIVMYLTLLIFLLPILSVICTRLILSIIFSIFYKGKYKLIECSNGWLALDRFANVCTLYLFAYISGPCDIELLRQRIHHIFTTYKRKDGSRPYEVMLCSVVRKFGFNCWENMRDSFDIKYHIRYLPGCSDPDRIYTETEMFEAAANLADDLWPESRPRWEFLVVPKMKKDGSDEVCSAIHFRFHHMYVDGISAAQIIRLCVADKPAPEFIFDPVRPPIPPTPFWMKLVTCLQVIFLGPCSTLQLSSGNEQNPFWEGSLAGGKYFGRTTMDIPIKKIRQIRRFYKCSTTAIQHYLYTGALRKLAEKNGCSVPEEVLAAVTFALLPYPHEYPQNHVSFIIQKSPIGKDGLDRLHGMEIACSKTAHPMNYYAVVTNRLVIQLVGLMPAALIAKSAGSVKMSYYVSNVPGIKDTLYFKGNNVLNVFGVGPVGSTIRYGAGVTYYDNKFVFGFASEKSQLVRNRNDFNYFIRQFENEVKILLDSVPSD